MRQIKVTVLFVLICSLSLALITDVTGQTKKTTAKPKPKTGTKTTPATGGKADLALGGKVFSDNCTACHDKGGNIIEADKSLKLADLKKNGLANVAGIKTRVMEGRGVMQAYQNTLKPNEIDAVSAYVWAQAQKNWK